MMANIGLCTVYIPNAATVFLFSLQFLATAHYYLIHHEYVISIRSEHIGVILVHYILIWD
jgi:hypothetical protein